MRSQMKFLALLSLNVFLCSVCYAATITGKVKGVDGTPFQGAFVEAQNAKSKITVIVLSDSQGRYRVEGWWGGNLAAEKTFEIKRSITSFAAKTVNGPAV